MNPESHTAQPLPDEDKHQKQYDMLRAEIMSLVEESRRMEIYAVVAVAGLYAWVLKEGSPNLDNHVLFLGAAIVFLAGLRSLSLLWKIKDIARYLIRIEESFFGAKPRIETLPGWERHRAGTGKLEPPAVPGVTVAFWVLFLICATVAPMLIGTLADGRGGWAGQSAAPEAYHTTRNDTATFHNRTNGEPFSTRARDGMNSTVSSESDGDANKARIIGARGVQTKGAIPIRKVNTNAP